MRSSLPAQQPPDEVSANLIARYERVRRASVALAAGLSPEDCTAQSMTDASPVKWHLAHTSWFFETFVLEAAAEGYRHFNPDFRYLFNSYYNTVGAQYPRPQRGLVTRPGLAEILAYRRYVDERLVARLESGEVTDRSLAGVVEVGLHHEQQHQELILTDLKHLFSFNPLHPVYRESRPGPEGTGAAPGWVRFPERLVAIGHAGGGFAFDNERPRHRFFLEPFELAARPVTNGEFLEFVRHGGYTTPQLWLSDGWATVQDRGWRQPIYWLERDGAWLEYTLGGLRPLQPDQPVCHVSYYEADAYATWAGARLPREQEWESAAAAVPVEGNLVESGHFHPRPPRTRAGQPAGLFGDVWEWTQSPYTPYPGYRTPPGAIGEYNGKFMCNQLVLRGGSCATPSSHIRATYRNFFPPDARWQFSGIRLARDS
jgi:ergothioneine biosynthesis protein EgtB